MGKRFNKFVKLIIGRPDIFNLKKRINSVKNRRVILIGSPVHNNLGDHLIADNCHDFIKNLGFTEIIDVPEFYYDLFGKSIVISDKDIIFIVGGGWLGNDYEDANTICQMICQWPENKIIILPQTVYFSEKGQYAHSDDIAKVFNATDNVLLCVREKRSFRIAIETLKIPKDRVLLSPDITLYNSEYLPYNDEKKGVILSIRNDRETIDEKLDTTIREILNELGQEYYESSTVVRGKIIPKALRKRVIKNKIKEYNKCDFIITNRLHSMIFAILSKTKCLAFDNSTHKVQETIMSWFTDNPNVYYISSSDYSELKAEIESVSKMEFKDYVFSDRKIFEDLKKCIGDFINE